MQIHRLDEIIDKYNKTYRGSIKVKSIDVNPSKQIEYDVKHNSNDPNFKVGDHVKISKYKNIFPKRNTPNWSEEVFVIKKVKKMLRGGCALLVVSLVKKLLEHSMKKSCRRPVKKTPKQ